MKAKAREGRETEKLTERSPLLGDDYIALTSFPSSSSSSSSYTSLSTSTSPTRLTTVPFPASTNATTVSSTATSPTRATLVPFPTPAPNTNSSTPAYYPRGEGKSELKSDPGGFDSLPELKNFNEIIIKSKFSLQHSLERAQNLAKEFNSHLRRNPIIVDASFIRSGERLDPGQVMVAHVNRDPEMYIGDGTRKCLAFQGPFDEKAVLGIYNINDEVYGAYGVYVLNIPLGNVAKAKSSGQFLLFGEGLHVLHDATFQYDEHDQTRITPLSNSYIKHGNIHIFRVPLNMYAKIVVQNQPYLLPHRETSYVIASNYVDEFHPQTDFVSTQEVYIRHGNLHVIRIPVGTVGKIEYENKKILVEHQEEPYKIKANIFKFDPRHDIVDKTDNYIHHGPRHIIRIPKGYLVTAWSEGMPLILEHQETPYIFDDPTFRIAFEQAEEYEGFDERERKDSSSRRRKISQGDNKYEQEHIFRSTSTKLIQVGCLKRIFPPLNEVAITNEDGKLKVVSEPTVIQSATHVVVGWLNTGIRTIAVPNEEKKKQRVAENPKLSSDEKNYEIFMTKDSLKVGVKLLIAYRVTNPHQALTALVTPEGIQDHIEGLVCSDMNKTILQSSSQEFLTSYQTKPVHKRGGEVKDDRSSAPSPSPSLSAPSAPTAPMGQSYLDTVTQQLADHLVEYGIDLIRMNVQEFKLLNEQIAGEMSKQALVTAAAAAEQAVLDTKYIIARKQAQQEAEVQTIAQSQKNNMLVAQAEARYQQTEIDCKAVLEKAKADGEALVIRAQKEAEAVEIRAKAENKAKVLQGELLEKYSELSKYQTAQLKFEALSKIHNFNVTTTELAQLWGPMALRGKGITGMFADGE